MNFYKNFNNLYNFIYFLSFHNKNFYKYHKSNYLLHIDISFVPITRIQKKIKCLQMEVYFCKSNIMKHYYISIYYVIILCNSKYIIIYYSIYIIKLLSLYFFFNCIIVSNIRKQNRYSRHFLLLNFYN